MIPLAFIAGIVGGILLCFLFAALAVGVHADRVDELSDEHAEHLWVGSGHGGAE